MSIAPQRQYLENKVLMASREDLLLMLFDGAIRFAEQAWPRLEAKEYPEYCALLVKAQDVVRELMVSMKREELGEDLYGNLMNLYQFILSRLVKANLKKDRKLIDEALKILIHLRETWAQAIEKDRREKFPELAAVQAIAKEASVSSSSAPLAFEV